MGSRGVSVSVKEHGERRRECDVGVREQRPRGAEVNQISVNMSQPHTHTQGAWGAGGEESARKSPSGDRTQHEPGDRAHSVQLEPGDRARSQNGPGVGGGYGRRPDGDAGARRQRHRVRADRLRDQVLADRAPRRSAGGAGSPRPLPFSLRV